MQPINKNMKNIAVKIVSFLVSLLFAASCAAKNIEYVEISPEDAVALVGGACGKCDTNTTSCPGLGTTPTGCGEYSKGKCAGDDIKDRADSNGSVRRCKNDGPNKCVDDAFNSMYPKCFKYNWTCQPYTDAWGIKCKYVSSNEYPNGSDCLEM